MKALLLFLGLTVFFLAADPISARTQVKENQGKVPKKWQAAKDQNTGEPSDRAQPPTGNDDARQEPVTGDSSRPSAEDVATSNENVEEEPVQLPKTEESTEKSDEAYGVGSLCGYCGYCKFCNLCDKDCPCETSKKKPNCHLCKYCKYCSLCTVCDTICTPGGFVDMFTSSIYSSLPSLDKDTKEKVDKDIDNARDFIKEYL